MSRALKDIVTAYKNMDIENISVVKEDTSSKGLVKKRPTMRGINYTNPAVRVGQQMCVIRNYRKGIEDA